jgi:hypothetical protein
MSQRRMHYRRQLVLQEVAAERLRNVTPDPRGFELGFLAHQSNQAEDYKATERVEQLWDACNRLVYVYVKPDVDTVIPPPAAIVAMKKKRFEVSPNQPFIATFFKKRNQSASENETDQNETDTNSNV